MAESIYDVMETAGHNCTILSGPIAGHSHYWCEGCGAIFIVRRILADDTIFQAPAGSTSTLRKCSNQHELSPLKDKLRKLSEEEYARMRERDDPFGGLPPGVNFGEPK